MLKVFPRQTKSAPGIVLVTDQDYFEVAEKMLSTAQKSVELMGFSFVTGDERSLYFKSRPFALMQVLKKLKKDTGLSIRVYLEGKRDTAEKNRFTAEHLTKAGIEVRLGATHVKVLIVDGRYTLLGSTNLTEQSLTKNFEANVLLDSPAIAKQVEKYFAHAWGKGKQGGVSLKPPLLADGAFKDQIVGAINKAKRTIHFSIYFFYQKEIQAALIAAFERGVKITGLLHQHARFGGDDIRRNHVTFKKLHEAGLRNIKFSDGSTFYHSKYIVLDGETTFIGTGNWLDRDVDTHPQLYCKLKNKALARALIQHLKSAMTHRK